MRSPPALTDRLPKQIHSPALRAGDSSPVLTQRPVEAPRLLIAWLAIREGRQLFLFMPGLCWRIGTTRRLRTGWRTRLVPHNGAIRGSGVTPRTNRCSWFKEAFQPDGHIAAPPRCSTAADCELNQILVGGGCGVFLGVRAVAPCLSGPGSRDATKQVGDHATEPIRKVLQSFQRHVLFSQRQVIWNLPAQIENTRSCCLYRNGR